MKHDIFLPRQSAGLGYASQVTLVAVGEKRGQQGLEGEEAGFDYCVYSWFGVELWEYGLS